MRLLVTGAAGFLGFAVCRELAGRHEVHGVWRSRPLAWPGVTAHQCDLVDPAAVGALWARVRPEGVIHAAALAQPNLCQQNPDLSRRLNVDLPARLAARCADTGARLVFTSTDLVFDGRRGGYAEEDPVNPLSLYGEHKVLAEAAVLARCPSAWVCRMALMYGPAAPGGESFVQPMLRTMAEGGVLSLFTDEFRTPLAAQDAARGLELALLAEEPVREETGSAGGRILHLGGPESLSRHRFGLLLAQARAERSGPGRAELKPLSQADLPMAAPRPRDVTLNIAKARRLGFAPGAPAERLRELLSVHEENPAPSDASAG